MPGRRSRRLVETQALLYVNKRSGSKFTLKTTNHTKVNAVLERCHSDNAAYGHRFPVVQKGRFADVFLQHDERLPGVGWSEKKKGNDVLLKGHEQQVLQLPLT